MVVDSQQYLWKTSQVQKLNVTNGLKMALSASVAAVPVQCHVNPAAPSCT